MLVEEALYHTTVRVISYGNGSWYLPLPKAMRDKLRVYKDCLIELAVIKVIPPSVSEE